MVGLGFETGSEQDFKLYLLLSRVSTAQFREQSRGWVKTRGIKGGDTFLERFLTLRLGIDIRWLISRCSSNSNLRQVNSQK